MLEALLERMDEWRRLGCKESADDSRIIGHVPRDYPQAYLHRFFAPRPKSEWETYGFEPTGQFEQLYAECNGLSLFSGALCVYGIRSHYIRDESAQFQPFDLIHHHEEHLRVWPNPNYSSVFFGSYCQDGSGVYAETESPIVYRLIRGETKPANEWPDIKTLLESEYERIRKRFNLEGY